MDNSDNPNSPSAEQIMKTYETVYLFKWLFPESNTNFNTQYKNK